MHQRDPEVSTLKSYSDSESVPMTKETKPVVNLLSASDLYFAAQFPFIHLSCTFTCRIPNSYGQSFFLKILSGFPIWRTRSLDPLFAR